MVEVSLTLVPMTCGECGVVFGMTAALKKERLDNGGTFYCTNGHGRVFRESNLDKIRRERDRLKQDQAWYEERNRKLVEERDHEARRGAAARGQVTKIKRRVAGGACPCCNRTFVDLHRHMTSKHPGFAASEP
jgi:hypothetical protein